jgi:Holliday junction resolvase
VVESADEESSGVTPDDVARLIQEVLAKCGWEGNATEIAEKVRRLNFGLPAEDEFSVLCAWLGKCQLLHKLDQAQVPVSSKDRYQVPDLLARFSTQADERPVLIEVKSSAKNTLSLTPEYLGRLQSYAELMGMPLLIAWRKPSFNMWLLFEARHLQKKEKNYNIGFHDAMKNSLMCSLVGDFPYKVVPNTSMQLRFRKDELVGVKEGDEEGGWVERWKVVIDDVYFANASGEKLTLPADVQSLFMAWDNDFYEEHSPTHIVQRNVAQDVIQYAHRVLTSLIHWERKEVKDVQWRQLLQKKQILQSVNNLHETIERGKKLGVVEGASFIVVPHDMPAFLPQQLEGSAS